MLSSVPECQQGMIYADLSEYGKRTPQVIGGYYPDVYYRTPSYFLIGEAKTDGDIDNFHTNAQIDCYIQELRLGPQKEKHLVISSSIYSFAMLKNMIALKKRCEDLNDIKFHIIDNFGQVAVL
jgi:hypothetical protein